MGTLPRPAGGAAGAAFRAARSGETPGVYAPAVFPRNAPGIEPSCFDGLARPGYGVPPMTPRITPRRTRRTVLALALAAAGAGCETPIGESSDRTLRESVLDSVRRETADATRYAGPRTTNRTPATELLGINPDLLPELRGMAGPEATEPKELDYGDGIIGQVGKVKRVSLEHAVRSAAEHNLQVQFARLAPAVTEAQLVAAEAAFDWTFFSNLNYASTDEPRIQTSQSGFSFTLPGVQQQTVLFNAGLRRPLVTGGQVTIQHDLNTTDDTTGGQISRPDAAYQTAVTLQVDQPLLRGAGSDVALAEVRLSRNAERNSISSLRRDLIKAITDTEKTYWQLVLSYRQLQIQQRLLDRGLETRSLIEGRKQLDATDSQISSTKGRVERRKADLLRAQTQLRQTSDRLKNLMNDPDSPIASEVVLVPADDALDEALNFDLLDCVQAGVTLRPEIEQAILSIDDASIRRVVADNSRLPRLDLRLQVKYQAMDNPILDAYENTFDGTFVNYLVGLVFEQPIGNRRAEADFRRRTIERMQAVLSYRNTVQQVMLEILTALRSTTTNYRLIEQTRASRLATSDELRALIVETRLLRGLTVERLNLALDTQERLAATEREEAQAVADYNAAIADLYASMGRTLDRNRIDFKVPDPAEAAAERWPANKPRPEPPARSNDDGAGPR